jgi:SAM-dependent methyltransferase
MNNGIFIPPQKSFDETDVWSWYNNLPKEIELLDLSSVEQEHIKCYYQEAGLLDSAKKGFFRHHFSETFYSAANFLLDKEKNIPTVLDLGAGTGTQSLFFAIQGAKVIALDMDTVALDILRKRKAFYEEQLGHTLNINIYEQNIFDFKLKDSEKIDAVYSLFAFNMMQPSGKLIGRLMHYLNKDARFCVLDGNKSSLRSLLIYSRRRPNVWSPREFNQALRKQNFRIIKHSGGISLPPVFWRLPIFYKISNLLDKKISQSFFFPISHQIMAQLNLPDSE